jgi:hypothetical protein
MQNEEIPALVVVCTDKPFALTLKKYLLNFGSSLERFYCIPKYIKKYTVTTLNLAMK